MNQTPEQADDADSSAPDSHLGESLRALLGSPDDVRFRAAAGVDRTLQGRSLISSLTELSGAGWATVRHLLTNPTGPADKKRVRSTDKDVHHD